MANRRDRCVGQLELFRPRPERPAWRTLPKEIRQKTVKLLAQPLRDHRVGRLAGGRKGVKRSSYIISRARRSFTRKWQQLVRQDSLPFLSDPLVLDESGKNTPGRTMDQWNHCEWALIAVRRGYVACAYVICAVRRLLHCDKRSSNSVFTRNTLSRLLACSSMVWATRLASSSSRTTVRNHLSSSAKLSAGYLSPSSLAMC